MSVRWHHDRVVPIGAYSAVMAAGIIAAAARENGLGALAVGFGVAAAALYVVLLVAGAALPGRVRLALSDPGSGFTVLTVVAATNVLAGLAGGDVLLALAVLALLVLCRPLVLHARRWPHHAARGNWLLAVVALQSVVVVVAVLRLAPLAVPAELAWCAGLALYTVIASWLLARLRNRPADFTPDWWILTGALAISALAGASLLTDLHGAAPLATPLRLLSVAALGLGGLAMPVLAVLDARRLLRTPARWYEPARWAMVFPLGMWSAASHAVAALLGWPPLQPLSLALLACAITACTATALGAATTWYRRLTAGDADQT
jgi:tellurite resistance protein TehA-like permease